MILEEAAELEKKKKPKESTKLLETLLSPASPDIYSPMTSLEWEKLEGTIWTTRLFGSLHNLNQPLDVLTKMSVCTRHNSKAMKHDQRTLENTLTFE